LDSMFGSKRGKEKDRESVKSRGRDKDGAHRVNDSSSYFTVRF
uniref:Myelin basic protein n=1 Tax=Anisakis simplex TaxID=6269 RepID=A0A0M3J4G1_ANISI